MVIRFHPSASRHGVSPQRATFVVERSGRPLYVVDPSADEAQLVLFLGPDHRGVPLEVVAVELRDGDLLVIHAMRMRAKYAGVYAEGMRWP